MVHNIGIVDQTWYAESLNNSERAIAVVNEALKKAGYTSQKVAQNPNLVDSGSAFDTLNTSNNTELPQARFLVAGTITKAWMTVRGDGWGGFSTDVDMKVTWEVYDTLKNDIILTQETYAIDKGGGMTDAYYYTVLNKCAAKFFGSPEFENALKTRLANAP